MLLVSITARSQPSGSQQPGLSRDDWVVAFGTNSRHTGWPIGEPRVLNLGGLSQSKRLSTAHQRRHQIRRQRGFAGSALSVKYYNFLHKQMFT